MLHSNTVPRHCGGAAKLRSNPMCDYSLHAVASRPAQVGETLITTAFPRTTTRGFASESAPEVAVCMLPGTELAFADNVKYQSHWAVAESYRVARGKIQRAGSAGTPAPSR